MSVPTQLAGQKYLSLTTFRKTGVPVSTPVWFAEDDGKLYLFTNPKSGKVKRIRNNPRVRIAPCTMRGRVTGPEFEAVARIIPSSEAGLGLSRMKKKYWLMRIPFLWSKDSIFIELVLSQR
ncbi:MAG TPA: PPOX class F420-dependent oxidoreductase [Terriglobales bacterium]|nr:PPOX class F420-dependent oxidoreductase [Terriglobales bacterium]